MRLISLFILAIFAALLLCSCGSYTGTTVKGEEITFDDMSSHKAGDTLTLCRTGLYFRPAMFQHHEDRDTVVFAQDGSPIEYANVIIK